MIQDTPFGVSAWDPLTSNDRGYSLFLKEAVALLPEMLIVKVAPKDHMLASIRTQGEEHSHEVFIIGVTLSNLDIYGSDIYITQASCQELICRCGDVIDKSEMSRGAHPR
jgi:hypothetical protein